MKFDDIMEAFEFVGSGQDINTQAYISWETGVIYFDSDDYSPEDLPKDLEDHKKYLSVPHWYDLNIGTNLVFDFAFDYMRDEYDELVRIFRGRGKYKKFRWMLEDTNKLQQWYDYEQSRKNEAVVEWCLDKRLEVEDIKELFPELVKNYIPVRSDL